MRIVMLGAPGSGKGTQAKLLETDRGVPQISTGDLLRTAVAEGTELGLIARSVMESGELVSDAIVSAMIKERFGEADAAGGFILDGYPRTLAQAEDLNGVLGELGLELDAVILMDVSTGVLMKRLTGRRTCSKTGKLLNIYFSPPEELAACRDAGGELLRRDDDNEAAIANRLAVYERQTAPLIDYYRGRGLLKTVAAEGAVDAIQARLRETLGFA